MNVPLGQYMQLDQGESLFVAIERQQEVEVTMDIKAIGYVAR